MAFLIAQGAEAHHRWRRALPLDRTVELGRESGTWSAEWDGQISRQHAFMKWDGDRLEVTRLPDARNPIFFRGHEAQRCFLVPGDHFVIGQTTFALTDEEVELSINEPAPFDQRKYSAGYLKKMQFQNIGNRIDVLLQLPDLISKATDDNELYVQFINVILAGIPAAVGAALVALPHDETSSTELEVLHWDRRPLERALFQPSETLIRQAIESQESVLHVWDRSTSSDFTVSENVDWAFCTPVENGSTVGWGIYVAGRFSSDAVAEHGSSQSTMIREVGLGDDLKFTELAASTLRSIWQLKQLERNNSSLRQFFSPVVLEALAEKGPEEVLTPRECDVTVLFCDLRGFSQTSELAADQLLSLLNRVSQALGVMTNNILDHRGVIGDFQGDAAMGFWGWPFAQEDAADLACRAALAIREVFAKARRQGDALNEFRVGMGIASGRSVAGRLGSDDQVKVTVFGPVVNLASRLEGMTKQLQAPILMDETTRQILERRRAKEGLADLRWRRVARVRPYGMRTPVEVAELLPSVEAFPELSDEHIDAYESALDALYAKDWEQAFQLLHQVPAVDQVKDFLTVYIAQHQRVAPPDFDGVIPLKAK